MNNNNIDSNDDFVNITCKKEIKKIKKSDFYHDIYRSSKVLVSHDFDQFQKDLPRTNGYVFNPQIPLLNASVNKIISYFCHSSHKLYNVLNIIPQQTYLYALQWIQKHYNNHILSNVKQHTIIDKNKITKLIQGNLYLENKYGFVDENNPRAFFKSNIISFHKKKYIIIMHIAYIINNI